MYTRLVFEPPPRFVHSITKMIIEKIMMGRWVGNNWMNLNNKKKLLSRFDNRLEHRNFAWITFVSFTSVRIYFRDFDIDSRCRYSMIMMTIPRKRLFLSRKILSQIKLRKKFARSTLENHEWIFFVRVDFIYLRESTRWVVGKYWIDIIDSEQQAVLEK